VQGKTVRHTCPDPRCRCKVARDPNCAALTTQDLRYGVKQCFVMIRRTKYCPVNVTSTNPASDSLATYFFNNIDFNNLIAGLNNEQNQIKFFAESNKWILPQLQP
jgi:hypothetical protein